MKNDKNILKQIKTDVVPENRTAVSGGIQPYRGESQSMAKRRNFSAAFKAKVALEALRGDRTLAGRCHIRRGVVK